jgi:hypothetical protein
VALLAAIHYHLSGFGIRSAGARLRRDPSGLSAKRSEKSS